jgi:multidrug efflux system membrane fusion protein
MRAIRSIKLLALGTIVALLQTGCGKDADHEPQLLSVRAQVVEDSREAGGVRYSAEIRPDVQIDLAFKVGGYIDQILQVRGADGRTRNVQEGDYVRRGTMLAHVRDSEYRDRVAEAQASLTQARSEFERAASLYENHTISKADYDAAYARSTSAKARYDQAMLSLEDASLESPMDGWVMRRAIEVGTLVSPGAPGFVVADTRAVKVVFGVPDVAVNALTIGDAQEMTCEAAPGETFRGKITRISPSADPSSRVFEVECTIPNPENTLKAGMIAALEARTRDARAAAALVPLSSVVRPKDDPAGYAVFVVEDHEGKAVARERTVKLGELNGNSVAVTEGLRGGEKVIVMGATLVQDQQEVRILP